ncbi:cytoplasmic protein [Laetiporus sulphureus 93-53]|uniref:Cytoplasmic protein n=1 Tax=Laetiporus sulphureus 93-53 TaxID=1314785 RepID=A0A165DD38_9APHY|nr:cytoplasmic protein [Laetiporus sulphureus 93-53]KZT04604.1 cytoplasmic protein [Laetiporus sulphureus 93-53]
MAGNAGNPVVPNQRRGVWEPLPLILYGYAVHPLSPNRRDTKLSSRTRASTFTSTTDASGDEHLVHRDVVSLEVGDSVYAFEQYTPKDKEVEGIWYRGYVVSTSRRPQVNWALVSDPSCSTQKAAALAGEQQQVFIGTFPASHIFVRERLSDEEGHLAEVANEWRAGLPAHQSDVNSVWKEKVLGGFATPREDDGLSLKDGISFKDTVSRKSFKLPPPPDQANSARARVPVYPASLRSASPTESQLMKPFPPRFSLKSGDDTASGADQPIIDEIASALREWHTLMFQYLARRDYQLFQIVREHIEALHLGRRQLLAQTLSSEETANLRCECVWRLVSGNLVQGLDVIVRHPTGGGLATVDVEGEIDPRSWMSAIRMYALQVSLAYVDVSPPTHPYKSRQLGSSMDYSASAASQVHNTFLEYSRSRIQSRMMGVFGSPSTPQPAKAKFYNIFLDLRAFIASPCSPGETAELFFSLFNKTQARFISEEFCAILNHNGVLARDPSARIRTLFTDVLQSDAQEPVFLVCKIVRNGSMKKGNAGSIRENGRRASEASIGTSNNGSGHIYGHAAAASEVIGNSNTDTTAHFRRPFGCAILELTQLATMAAEQTQVSSTREHYMPIYTPKNESTFSMLHVDIINGNTKEYEKSGSADTMAVSIKLFYGSAETVVRENTSLLQDIPLSLRLGFPDVVFPGDVRNELYVKLWSGDFSPSQTMMARRSITNFPWGQAGSIGGNVQVTVEVKNQHGRTIERVISYCSGEPEVTQFNSMVFQRTNQPTFNELIKLELPFEGSHQWHLFFTFRHRSTRERSSSRNSEMQERPFAFAFLPLFPDGRAFLEDGEHTLVLYNAEKLTQVDTDLYLAATPWLPANQRPEQVYVPVELQKLAPPMRDCLILRTSLCSTKFTQNSVLLSLLNWEKLADKEVLKTVLTKFTFVGEVEIVKFLRDIFDSLFAILASNNNEEGEMDDLVFSALVVVLGIIQDRRFSNFQPVLDVYIAEHFRCAAAASHIISSMNRLLQNPTASETASALRSSLKVWHYIVKFIVRSRELQKAKKLGMGGGATADHLEATFKRELRSYLAEVNSMMSTTTPASIIGTQTIALQHFTSILQELDKVFSHEELVNIAATFANSIKTTKGKLVIWKLVMHLQIVKGFLFDDLHSRTLLIESVADWLQPHFGRFDEYAQTQPGDSESARDAARVAWLESIRLSVSVIAIMLDKCLQSLVNPAIVADRNLLKAEQDNIEFLLHLFPKLLNSYSEFKHPASQRAIERNRSSSPVSSTYPITFPESYPFALAAQLSKSASAVSGSFDSRPDFNPGLGETAIVLLSLILAAPKKHLISFFQSFLDIEGSDNFAAMLMQTFKVAASILNNDAFPSNWLNVNILAHRMLLKLMDPIVNLMEREFIPNQESRREFNSNIWREAFYVVLKLLSSEHLVIEEFIPQKRRTVWRLAGDIRGEGAALLLRMWDALGWSEELANGGTMKVHENYEAALNPLVGHVVNLCLSHHDQLQFNAVHILYCMIISEYHVSGNFNHIEHELVSKLDTLFMSDSKGDDISRAFFIGYLRRLFEESDVDEQLRALVDTFLQEVNMFLDLLLSVRALPEGEEFADDRVIATLRLMNFIRRIGRDEIYIKYVHQLVNMHLQAQNYVEAALTLKLHADLHDWDLNSFAPPMEDLGLPQQSHFHRKETLYLLILDYLGKGKAWESAIEICKELAVQHAEVTFNYARLAEILRHKAALLERIVTDQRYYSDYFRVAFYGSFPAAIRNKQFIYRGYEWEKFGAFCERMLNKHPGVQLLKPMGDPPVDIRFGTDQYIQCTAVTPEPERDLPIFTNPDVSPQIRAYYEHSAIKLFSYSRPVTRISPDGSEEVWIEKTYLTTEEAFPTVLRRSEVVDTQMVQISPVQSAIQEVEEKTRELTGLNLRYSILAKTSQAVPTNALAMNLNAAVDAPAGSGIGAFRQAYLNEEYISKHPDRAEEIENLRNVIDDQARVIDSCLRLHGQLCPPEMMSFHGTLEKFFRKNFQEEIQRLAMDSGRSSRDLLTPSPSASRPLAQSQRQMRPQLGLVPVQVHAAISPALSPLSNSSNPDIGQSAEMSSKQTPLQRHLAHLARHGFNGVSAGPGDVGSDSISEESPRDSYLNNGTLITTLSGAASVTGSNIGSIGSIRGRLSKFSSLNFARRDM